MTEHESLLLDVGNALGVLAVVACCFIVATAVGMVYEGIKQLISK
jgi:hypothetical protein